MSISTILLENDNVATHQFIKEVFARRGYTVTLVRQGSEIVQQLESGRYELAILNCDNGDGPARLELCARYAKRLPVMIISSDQIAEEAKLAGAARFIPRPASINQIMRTIQLQELSNKAVRNEVA